MISKASLGYILIAVCQVSCQQVATRTDSLSGDKVKEYLYSDEYLKGKTLDIGVLPLNDNYYDIVGRSDDSLTSVTAENPSDTETRCINHSQYLNAKYEFIMCFEEYATDLLLRHKLSGQSTTLAKQEGDGDEFSTVVSTFVDELTLIKVYEEGYYDSGTGDTTFISMRVRSKIILTDEGIGEIPLDTVYNLILID